METQPSTTQPLLEAPFAAVPASFWLWQQAGRTGRYSDVGLCRSSPGGWKIRCLQTCLKRHIWFSSTARCWTFLNPAAPQPRTVFLSPQASLPNMLIRIIKDPDTIRGTPGLCPLDCSVLWESLGCLRMMKTKFQILLQVLGKFPGSSFALMAWCYLSRTLLSSNTIKGCRRTPRAKGLKGLLKEKQLMSV